MFLLLLFFFFFSIKGYFFLIFRTQIIKANILLIIMKMSRNVPFYAPLSKVLIEEITDNKDDDIVEDLNFRFFILYLFFTFLCFLLIRKIRFLFYSFFQLNPCIFFLFEELLLNLIFKSRK